MKKDSCSTPRSEVLAKLEREVIKTALARFREWQKQHGEVNPDDFYGRKNALKHLLATKALHEAINGKR